jgi:hypothetical protein
LPSAFGGSFEGENVAAAGALMSESGSFEGEKVFRRIDQSPKVDRGGSFDVRSGSFEGEKNP